MQVSASVLVAAGRSQSNGVLMPSRSYPVVPPVPSLACFLSTRYWIIFMLMPIALLIEHAYFHGRKRQKEALLRLYRLVRHKGL